MASAATKCLFCNIAQGLDAKTTLLFQVTYVAIIETTIGNEGDF